jgi:hypothetical protein
MSLDNANQQVDEAMGEIVQQRVDEYLFLVPFCDSFQTKPHITSAICAFILFYKKNLIHLFYLFWVFFCLFDTLEISRPHPTRVHGEQ